MEFYTIKQNRIPLQCNFHIFEVFLLKSHKLLWNIWNCLLYYLFYSQIFHSLPKIQSWKNRLSNSHSKRVIGETLAQDFKTKLIMDLILRQKLPGKYRVFIKKVRFTLECRLDTTILSLILRMTKVLLPCFMDGLYGMKLGKTKNTHHLPVTVCY